VRATVGAACLLALCCLCLPASAEAAFPGPNGKIAFQRANDVWTVDPDGTDLRNITFSGGRDESDPAWSPDGRHLAFLRSDGGSRTLIVANADGNEPRIIVVPSFACHDLLHPAWSPDGRRIAFSCNDSNARDIWSIGADGTGLTRLTDEPAPTFRIDEVAPAWSPDGTKIAYQRGVGLTEEVWTMNPDGSGQARLVTEAASPDWSPDGQRIVFVSERDCTPTDLCNDVWRIDRTGSNLIRLTATAHLESRPSWSPDGQKIAFARCPHPETDPDFECRNGIFTTNTDGSGVAAVVGEQASQAAPSWQAAVPHLPPPDDPAKIAFVSYRDHSSVEDGSEIYTMNSDGSVMKRLTFNFRADGEPAWSPDGSRIAFSTGRDGNLEIYVMNADGSGQTRLTNNSVSDSSPTWSPDGNRIAYHRADSFSSRIHVMNADGTGDVAITGGHVDWTPDWSPDGSRIAFHGLPEEGKDGLLTVSPDGSGATPLTIGEDRWPAWSPAGDKIAFSRFEPEGSGSFAKIWVANADGSGATKITPDPGGWGHPTWSPDGRKMAFTGERDIYVANPDGTGRVNLNDDAFFDSDPDWRGPTIGYPRPRGAGPMRVALVIAYHECVSPDRTHAPPLAFGACGDPRMSSDHLTVGTGDSNGKPARNEGYVLLRVDRGSLSTPADEADVTITLFSDDVFTKSLEDYAGELRASIALRITDRRNTPSPGGRNAGTVSDLAIHMTAPCAPVSDPLEGSACAATTTVDALIPGAVKEGSRSVWELDRVRVYDGGADGVGDTAGDNTLFATQGVFIP